MVPIICVLFVWFISCKWIICFKPLISMNINLCQRITKMHYKCLFLYLVQIVKIQEDKNLIVFIYYFCSGKDHLYFQDSQKHLEFSVENEEVTATRSHNCQQAINSTVREPCDQTSNDILSGWLTTTQMQNILSNILLHYFTVLVLLERGNKLRDAMVASSVKGDLDAAQALKDAPLPLPKDNIIPPPRLVFRGISIVLFQSLSFNFVLYST